jgi:hypothetical protein
LILPPPFVYDSPVEDRRGICARGSNMPKEPETPRRPGKEPERVKIPGSWEDAATRMIRTPVPPGGLPKRETRPRRGKETQGR